MENEALLSQFKGESLLKGSHILSQIEDMKSAVKYETDEKSFSFEDYFLYVQRNIDGIKRIALLDSIPTMQSGQYENSLLSALEDILEQIEKWETRVIAFQGRLVRAKSDVEELGAAFESWYSLAAAEFMEGKKIKISASNVKALARSEFNRLMGHTNLAIDALVEAVKIEVRRLDSKRKMAKMKFALGCKQVDLSYASRLPEHKGYGDIPPFNVLSSGIVEEYDDLSPVTPEDKTEVSPEIKAETEVEDKPESTKSEVKTDAGMSTSPRDHVLDFDDRSSYDPPIKGTFRKEVVSGPVGYIEPWEIDESNDTEDTPLVQVVEEQSVAEAQNSVPVMTIDVDLGALTEPGSEPDDFDDEPVSAVKQEPVKQEPVKQEPVKQEPVGTDDVIPSPARKFDLDDLDDEPEAPKAETKAETKAEEAVINKQGPVKMKIIDDELDDILSMPEPPPDPIPAPTKVAVTKTPVFDYDDI